MFQAIQLTLAEEVLRLRLDKQDQCRHKFVYKTVAYLDCSDETVEVAVCKKCHFNED